MLRFFLATLLLSLCNCGFAQGTVSPEQLSQAYATALRNQNQKAFLDLFAFSTKQERAVAEQQFATQSKMRIESVKIVPFSVHEQRYKKAMARLGRSDATPPEAWAEIVFVPVKLPDGSVQQETSLLSIVRRDGRYFVSW
jgi:hypothetical protein